MISHVFKLTGITFTVYRLAQKLFTARLSHRLWWTIFKGKSNPLIYPFDSFFYLWDTFCYSNPFLWTSLTYRIDQRRLCVSMKVALVVSVVFDSLGWIFGFLLPVRYLFIHRSYPTWLGIKLLDGGPFARLGMDAIMLLAITYIIINAFKLLAAYWLWQLRMDGVVLEIILLMICAGFWYGFALPFGPPFALIQIVLMILLWKSFN